MTPSELKDWRGRHRFSIMDAAIALGAAYPTYNNWEYGRTPVPKSAELLMKYVDKFGTLPLSGK